MSRKYKLGDMWRDDFDYDGMIKMGLKTNSTWSISDLQKLYDSFEDVNYHTPNKYLGSAIFALENDLPDVADIKFAKFHKELNELEEDDDASGETNIDAELEDFDVDNLDDFETMQFNHHLPILGKVGALQVLINSVEGDYSQLSPELSELAEKQNLNFEMADGGETLKNYQVTGTLIQEFGGPVPPEADREDYIDIETEKFTISVMASSEAEAERIAEEEIKDKYLLNDYASSFGMKLYNSGSVEIEDVIETGRYAKGGKINKRKKYTYIPKEEIESITTWNGKNITQEKILDGAYVRGNVKYGNGGETDSLKIKIEEEGDNYEVNYQFDDYEISGVLQKYYTGRANEYEFQPSYFADEESEKYYDENWEDIEDEILGVFYSKFKKGGQVKRNKYGEGGSVEQGNLEMMKNQAIQVKHHADELVEILKSSPRIDAWVVSLMDRATQNLSNITHYLDGELKHFAKGGMVNDESIIAKYSDKERNVEGIYYFETAYGYDGNLDGKLYEILSIAKPSYDKENAAEVGSFKSKQDAMRWLERHSKAEGYYDILEFM